MAVLKRSHARRAPGCVKGGLERFCAQSSTVKAGNHMLRPAGELVARCFAHEVHAAEDAPLAALGSPVAVVFRDLARIVDAGISREVVVFAVEFWRACGVMQTLPVS